jgi:hypothetical protein
MSESSMMTTLLFGVGAVAALLLRAIKRRDDRAKRMMIQRILFQIGYRGKVCCIET